MEFLENNFRKSLIFRLTNVRNLLYKKFLLIYDKTGVIKQFF